MNTIFAARRPRLGLLAASLCAAFSQAYAQGPSAETAAAAADATDAADAADTATLQTVTVAGERESEARKARASGALGSRSDLETPFSTASVNAAQIEERQITTLAKVFAEDSSVSSKGGTYTQSAYAVSVRGLTLDFTNGYKIDGQPFQMYGVELPLESFESVQLLKGATGFLYGFAAPGGIINYVSKRPTDERTFSASAGYASSGLYREHVDAGGRFGDDDRFGYRANFAHEQGETYNGADLRRNAASLALDARISHYLTWSGNLLYQERDLKGGVPTISLQTYPAAASGLPAPVGGKADLGAYDSSYYDSTMWLATTALDWRFNQDWKASFNYGHSYKRIDSAYETLFLTSQSGNYSNRLNPFYRPTLEYNAFQSVVEGSFKTGPLKHSVTFGASHQTLSRTLNITSSLSLFNTGTSGNLYQAPPVLVDNWSTNRTSFYTISEYTQKSVFASDTIEYGPWSLLAGARYMDYENINYKVTGELNTAYRKKPTTPTVALLYRPSSNTTLYGSYVEALEDGGTVGTTYANANETLAPLTSRQAEIGAKTDHAGWGGSAALFRVKRGAAYADYSSDVRGVYIQGGELRYQGLELNGRLDVARGVTVNAGATWLDADYRATIPAVIGNRVESTPRFQALLGIDAKVAPVPGLSLHADASYIGNQAVNSANAWTAPPVTLFNLGAGYRTAYDGHGITYRVEVNNVADRAYWNSTASNALQIGAPRTVALNVRFDL